MGGMAWLAVFASLSEPSRNSRTTCKKFPELGTLNCMAPTNKACESEFSHFEDFEKEGRKT